MHAYIYIYIYIYTYTHVYIYIYIYKYIYINGSGSFEVVVLWLPVQSGTKHTAWSDSLRGSSVNIGTMQRRLAWPLRKDDTHNSRSENRQHGAKRRTSEATTAAKKQQLGGPQGSSFHRAVFVALNIAVIVLTQI